ncbi:guanylate kinase [Rhodoligotrophos appendicifer]|uniref:guanylate kinase n=1 Tax=Rhodoligotrophos appendicifer TaxID=987056 RepID=UPI00118492D6|nr:guanylate kinase [Rhodoligotrophos appendicifer]
MTAGQPAEPPPARRGLMLVLSSPSGAGKSTLTRRLNEEEQSLGRAFHLSVSVTTRARRPSEIDHRDYHFITRPRFESMRERGELLEWAEVHGNFYGTPREPVEQALARGQDVLFDIDWQGTLQLYESMRADVVSVFVLPPSIAELKARLERRAEDAPDIIARRLANSAVELRHWAEYDYVIINRDVADAFDSLKAILNAERVRRQRQPGLEAFVAGLLAELGAERQT